MAAVADWSQQLASAPAAGAETAQERDNDSNYDIWHRYIDSQMQGRTAEQPSAPGGEDQRERCSRMVIAPEHSTPPQRGGGDRNDIGQRGRDAENARVVLE